VFCTEHPNQGSAGPLEEVPIQESETGQWIDRSIRAGYVLYCIWYNRPYAPDETPIYDPTFYPTPDDGFEPGEDYTPTYTVEPPYEYTPTETYPADYTATATYPPDYTPTETYPADYTATATYEPGVTYTPEYTATYPAGPTSTPTSPGGGQIVVTATYTATVPNVTGPVQTPTYDPEATAALIIVSYACEADYNPSAEDADPLLDCDDAPGETRYALRTEEDGLGDESVEEDGDRYLARFEDLEGGVYTVQAITDEPAEYGFIGGCTSSLRTFGEYAFRPYAWVAPDGSVVLELLDGEELTCSWYRVPYGEGKVVLTVMECPGAVANPARCDSITDAVEVALVPAGDGETIAGETSDDGEIELTAPSGAYVVEIDGIPSCLVDSVAADDDGLLVLSGNEEVDAIAYSCALN
jgi:hypothetical protein